MAAINRIATDLEYLEKSGNLKETSESQEFGEKVRIPKVREKSGKVREFHIVWEVANLQKYV